MLKNQIEALQKLGLSDEEINEIIKTDKMIDDGANIYNLPREKELASAKARTPGNTKGYTKKKINKDKKLIISAITKIIKKINCVNIKILNDEREIIFEKNNKRYKIILSCPRV